MKARLFLTTLLAGYVVACFSDTLTIAMTGDIMMGTTFPEVSLPANNGKDLFQDTKEVLQGADVTVGNLEGTLCDDGISTKSGGPNSYSFRTPTSYGHLLKDVGYDFLSMANNHANDFGMTGIESTEKVLEQQSIKFAGIQGRVESAVITRKGVKIGFCAFGHNSYTLKHRDLKTVKRIIDDLKTRSDIIVVTEERKDVPRATCPTVARPSWEKTAVPYANLLISASTTELMLSMDMGRMWSVP